MQEDAKLAGTRGRPRCKAWKSTEVKLEERGQTLVGSGTKEMERPRAENSAVSDELAKDIGRERTSRCVTEEGKQVHRRRNDVERGDAAGREKRKSGERDEDDGACEQNFYKMTTLSVVTINPASLGITAVC